MLINCYRYYKHCTKHNYSATKVTFFLLQIINLLHVIANNKSKTSGIWTELNRFSNDHSVRVLNCVEKCSKNKRNIPYLAQKIRL